RTVPSTRSTRPAASPGTVAPRRPRTRRTTRSRFRAWAAGRLARSIRRCVGVRPVRVSPDLDVGIELLPRADVEDAVGDVRAFLREVTAVREPAPPRVVPGVRRIGPVEARRRAAVELPRVPLGRDDPAAP